MKEQIQYYKKRAEEYELIYLKEERQFDLAEIRTYLSNQFIGKEIIEIACGTGYWTEVISKQAKTIKGIDINKEVLEIAKKKIYRNENTYFDCIDYKDLNEVKQYEGFFGGFIWSHVLIEELEPFLKKLTSLLKINSELIFIDNIYVEGSSTPISRVDKNGNSYQKRKLKTGKEYEVIKNFPNKKELEEAISRFGKSIELIELEYYWILKFVKE